MLRSTVVYRPCTKCTTASASLMQKMCTPGQMQSSLRHLFVHVAFIIELFHHFPYERSGLDDKLTIVQALTTVSSTYFRIQVHCHCELLEGRRLLSAQLQHLSMHAPRFRTCQLGTSARRRLSSLRSRMRLPYKLRPTGPSTTAQTCGPTLPTALFANFVACLV